jgi:hypothetical protein
MLGAVKYVISDSLSRIGYQIQRSPRGGSSGYEPVTPLAETPAKSCFTTSMGTPS